MKKRILLIILSVIILLAIIPQTRLFIQVTFLNLVKTTSFTIDENNPEHLEMTGLINSKTFKQIKAEIKKNPQVSTIVMLDVPGSLDDETNFKMCNWVRSQGLTTLLLKDSHVASGGTDFFLAGKKRVLEKGARVGVHSWRDTLGKEAKDIPKTDQAHEMNRKYIEDMLGQDDFYWYTIYAASADDIYYMSLEEMNTYHIYTILK